MLDSLKSKRGQIFPFLVLILVILIIATMAYVNVSQVDTHKIDTMNAADAAALAGAGELAQCANTIANINVKLLKPNFWIHFWTGSFRPCVSGVPTSRLYQWYSLATGQLTMYLDSCLSAYKAVQSSAAVAHTTAFGGMGIEEAEKREGSPTGPRAKSNFSQWMDDQRFYDDRNLNPTELEYKWWPYQYDFEQKKQIQPDFGNDARAEKILTEVKKPDENSLELHPKIPLPQFTAYFGLGYGSPVCNPVGFWGLLILPPEEEMISNIGEARALIAAILAWELYTELHDGKTPAGMNNIWEELVVSLLIPVVGYIASWMNQLVCPAPPGEPVPCGCWYFNAGGAMYLVPVPWIIKLSSGTAEINVQVTRFSPTKDLGLWQFKHGSITSGARASMYGGSIHRHPGGYKIKVDEVWDGARNL